MPSSTHQLLVQMLVPRMHALRYQIVASDLYYYQLGRLRLDSPPVLARHRPDLLGVRGRSPRFCIAEAKTAGDLRTRHSKEQLSDFASVPDAMLLVAVPSGALATLERVVGDLGIQTGPRFECLAVPEALLG
jgi:hypothetical protein